MTSEHDRERAPIARWMRAAALALVAVMLVTGALSFFFYFTREGWQVCNGTVIECQVRLQYSTTQLAAFARQGVPLATMLAQRYVALALGSLIPLVMGLLILARRPGNGAALIMALMLVDMGTVYNEGVTGALIRAIPGVATPVQLLNQLSIPGMLLAMGLFPSGRPVPGWMRWGIPIMVVLGLALTNLGPGSPQWVTLLAALVLVLMLALLLYSQLVRYRRYSTPVEREQTKWALTGIVLFILTIMVSITLFSLDVLGENPLLQEIVGTLGFTLLPSAFLGVFIGIAVLRSRLWDIDVVIRRTLTYTLSTGALLIVFFGSVVLLQQLFAALTGARQNELVTVLSTLAIAALFVPIRNRVQGAIDRRFNRARYDAQKVLAGFAQTVRDETDLDKLTGRLLQTVAETMGPESVSLWLKK